MVKQQELRVLMHCLFLYGATEDNAGNQVQPVVAEDDWLYAIGLVKQRIINYCAIRSVPESHEYVWAQITVDFVRGWLEAAGVATITPAEDENGMDEIGTIEDIKVGDVTVGVKAKVSSGEAAANTLRLARLAAHTPKLDEFVYDYRGELQEIRRIKWR